MTTALGSIVVALPRRFESNLRSPPVNEKVSRNFFSSPLRSTQFSAPLKGKALKISGLFGEIALQSQHNY